MSNQNCLIIHWEYFALVHRNFWAFAHTELPISTVFRVKRVHMLSCSSVFDCAALAILSYLRTVHLPATSLNSFIHPRLNIVVEMIIATVQSLYYQHKLALTP